MQTDISGELDKEFGASGTPGRAKFDEEAYAFYTGQILLDARREAKATVSTSFPDHPFNKFLINSIFFGSSALIH